jgi:hypothetical protein
MAASVFKDKVVVITGASTWRGKLGVWLKLIAPGLVDHMARQAISPGR